MRADDVLMLEERWKNTNKDTIVDNMEKYLIRFNPECKKYNTKIKTLMEISGEKEQTVYAWINRSRKEVKIPFLKLCKIASALNIGVEDILG